MPTTYYLIGGTKKSESKTKLFTDIFTSVSKSDIKILLCLWSIDVDKWDKKFVEFKKESSLHTKKNIKIEIVKDVEDLNKKMPDFDIFYVVGGHAYNIEPYYSQLSNLKEWLEGKIYVGSSMGAFMVSSNYILSFDDQDYLTVHNGLSLLKINTLCHWDKEKRREMKIKMLKDESPDLPILTLDEGQFVKFVI